MSPTTDNKRRDSRPAAVGPTLPSVALSVGPVPSVGSAVK